MKDKVLLYWNQSSYLIRSVIIYTFFSILAIISKLLDDKLGMFSSMVAVGFLVSILGVIASMIYTLSMGINRKNVFKETFQAILIVIFFLFLMSLIVPTEIKKDIVQEKKIPEVMIHNAIAIPVPQKEK